ncbi:glycosyltransferase family 2 protein [Thermomonas sp.]|uniref:glycosyltransferase family 2 protein n=1 Tax=Thermomonas sp. TaxID=1971895 RepID=UPI001ACAF6B8|nr:glycosyltransferase [Stenotrophomonas nitritireducens]
MSYVVFSYNHARFVRQAIDSILAQDYPALELIVVDDGSTDGSRELLRSLSREKGFQLVEKDNGGIVSAVNVGIPLASGAFIVPHASDDVSHPGRTRAQVRALQSMPQAGFTVGGIRKISEDGSLLEDCQAIGPKIYCFEDFLWRRASASAVSCMYRAEAIRAVLPLDERISFEDVQLFWRVTEEGWQCLLDDRILAVDYRIVRHSLGRSRKVRLWRDFLQFIQRYQGHSWYDAVLMQANSGLFVQLAIEEKREAIRFLLEHAKSIHSLALLRGGLLLPVPELVVRRMRKKY